MYKEIIRSPNGRYIQFDPFDYSNGLFQLRIGVKVVYIKVLFSQVIPRILDRILEDY